MARFLHVFAVPSRVFKSSQKTGQSHVESFVTNVNQTIKSASFQDKRAFQVIFRSAGSSPLRRVSRIFWRPVEASDLLEQVLKTQSSSHSVDERPQLKENKRVHGQS